MDTVFSATKKASLSADVYDSCRTPQSIFNHALSEMGEIAIELNVLSGRTYKPCGADGVIGEAADAIVSLLDLIYIMKPNITEHELVSIISPKLVKWIDNIKGE